MIAKARTRHGAPPATPKVAKRKNPPARVPVDQRIDVLSSRSACQRPEQRESAEVPCQRPEPVEPNSRPLPEADELPERTPTETRPRGSTRPDTVTAEPCSPMTRPPSIRTP